MSQFPTKDEPVSARQLARMLVIALVIVLCCAHGPDSESGYRGPAYLQTPNFTPVPELTGPPFLPTKPG